jgi:hypothetical protein
MPLRETGDPRRWRRWFHIFGRKRASFISSRNCLVNGGYTASKVGMVEEANALGQGATL